MALGVEMMCANRGSSMMGDIYPGIGAAVGRSPQAVERAMRAALQAAQESPAWAYHWRQLGGWGDATNRELLLRIARAQNAD